MMRQLPLRFRSRSGSPKASGASLERPISAAPRFRYAIERYVKETNRLYGVLNHRLADRPYVAGAAYTIADIASYPWIVPYEKQQQSLDDFPHLKRWFNEIKAQPIWHESAARSGGRRLDSASSWQ